MRISNSSLPLNLSFYHTQLELHHANLTEIRVSEDPPFTHTGIDFAGPLYIKGGNCVGESDQDIKFMCVCLLALPPIESYSPRIKLTTRLNVHFFLTAF